MEFLKAIWAGIRKPTVFVVVASVTYILSSMLRIPAVDPGVVTLISIGGTLSGLALGRAFREGTRPFVNWRAIIAGAFFLVIALLAYVYARDNMTNGWLQYVILCLLYLIGFASFGFLADAAGLEIGEPPEQGKTS